MHFEEEDIALLLKAIRFSSMKHSTQRRKDAEATPYINHPIVVAEILWRMGKVRDLSTIIAAILHDTIEDTDTAPEELKKEFGNEVYSIVKEVSDDKNLPKKVRKRLQVETARDKSIQAKHIKIADKISNIQDLINAPPANWLMERKIEYISWSKEVVSKMRNTNVELERYFDQICANFLSSNS